MNKLFLFAVLSMALLLSCGDKKDAEGEGKDASVKDTGDEDAKSDDDDTGKDDDDNDDATLPDCEDPLNAELAFLRPDMAGKDGVFILPDGRQITPKGDMIKTAVFPMNMAVSPDGKYLVVTNGGHGKHQLQLIDVAKKESLHELEFKALYVGLVFNSQGELFAAGGTSNKVYRLKIAEGKLELVREYDVDGFPLGLFLSKDEKVLFVTSNTKQRIRGFNIESGEMIWQIESGNKYPYDVLITPDEKWIFWSNWGKENLAADPVVWYADYDKNTIENISVGKNPTQLLFSADKKQIYVSCGDADRIDVIDVDKKAVSHSILLSDEEPGKLTVSPVHMTLSSDGKRLYVASAIRSAILVVDIEKKKVIGGIPTSWYAVDVKLSADESELYWLSGKGEGSGANADHEYIGRMMRGTLGIIKMPSDQELADYLKTIDDNFRRPERFVRKDYGIDCRPPGNVLSQNPLYPSPIKHVVFIVKENRTYDQIFGALEFGKGDPDYLLYGEEVTPNQHALAREFVLFDNFYTESEISVQGHIFTTLTVSNDFTERTWPTTYRDERVIASGVDPASFPDCGFFKQHVLRHGLIPRSYGQIVGPGSNPSELFPYINLDYGFYNNDTKDVVKVQHFIKDLENDIFPDYIYISLPNDHTKGTRPGSPTPSSMVADNDEALGMIVEAISKSKYWESTLIFVTEDDPQDGADHVDAHRTIGLLISPWVKRGHLSSVHYSFASFFRTAEIILGLPPMHNNDKYAAPFVDCFADQMDNTPYELIPRKIPEKLNRLGAPGSWESMEMVFDLPDQNPDLGWILWQAEKGENAPTPRQIKEMRAKGLID